MTQPGRSPLSPERSQPRRGSAYRVVGAGMVAMLALAGCGQGSEAKPVTSAPGALPSTHVHGISRDPGSGKVNLATHTGLFVMQPDASWQRVGPEVDLLGQVEARRPAAGRHRERDAGSECDGRPATRGHGRCVEAGRGQWLTRRCGAGHRW